MAVNWPTPFLIPTDRGISMLRHMEETVDRLVRSLEAQLLLPLSERCKLYRGGRISRLNSDRLIRSRIRRAQRTRQRLRCRWLEIRSLQ